jgi:MFS family permease
MGSVASVEGEQVPRRVAMAIALGTLLNPLNSSMIAVALVALQHAFGVGVATSSWLVSSFYLAACVGQPLMGRIADRFGPRRVYCAGLVVAGAAGALAAVSPWFAWLVACRVLQAVGTSAAYPSGLALIRRLAGGRSMPAATLAAISIANGTSAALGPLFGGFLIAGAGWRGIFAVNVPLAAAGLALALRWLPRDAPAGVPAEPRAVVADLDLPGVALFSATVLGLLGFLLSLATRPQWWLLVVFPVAAALLVRQELRVSTPFLDLRTLARQPALLRTLAQQVGVQMVFYSVFYGLPLWLERVRHFPARDAGLLMLPLAALGIGLSPVAATLVRRKGVRVPLLIGCAGLVAGLLLVATLDEGTPVVGIVAVGTVLGLPSAFNNLALQAAVYAAAPAGQVGLATGLFQTCRYLGAIMSTALLGLAFEHEVSSAGLHRTAVAMALVAVGLTVAAAGSGHVGTHRRAKQNGADMLMPATGGSDGSGISGTT